MIVALVEKPDLIVSEIQLADGSSGIELINSLYPLLDCYAIFVTAYPEMLLTGDRPQPLQLITKPFSENDLLAKIRSAMQVVLERRAQSKRSPDG